MQPGRGNFNIRWFFASGPITPTCLENWQSAVRRNGIEGKIGLPQPVTRTTDIAVIAMVESESLKPEPALVG